MNKTNRAKFAKETINIVIPRILKGNARARAGVESSVLIKYSPPSSSPYYEDVVKGKGTTKGKRKGKLERETEGEGEGGEKVEGKVIGSTIQAAKSKATASSPSQLDTTLQTTSTKKTKITVLKSDTFTASHTLLSSLPQSPSKHHLSRTAVLNLASCYEPSGGVLRGAIAQEESLCLRSTLYPSLLISPSFYRLPEDCAIYTKDVLIFRGEDEEELPKSERWFVDVISIAALRNPDVERTKVKDAEEKETEKLIYENAKDRTVMKDKVRLIFQTAREKGVTHLVLGALGCGAYRNPPEEVARIFWEVMVGEAGDGEEGVMEGIEEAVFAIFDEGVNLRVFGEVFKGLG